MESFMDSWSGKWALRKIRPTVALMLPTYENPTAIKQQRRKYKAMSIVYTGYRWHT